MTPAPFQSLAIALALAGAIVAIAAETVLPANVYSAALSPLVVAVLALGHRRWLVWTVAVVLAGAAIAGLWVGPGAVPPVPPTPLMLLNRGFSAASILATAGVATLWIRAQGALRLERRSLQVQNRALEDANAQLVAREAEIASQNEELQLQSEELERQSEELRIANDDLASRERVLAQLLELSRSLAGELTTADVLARVCDSLTVVLTPRCTAAAILRHEGDQVRVACHMGFGDDPPDVQSLPFAQSFTSLIVTRGQTGYVQDLALRPDLRVPQPRAGLPFVSVLGAPIWIRGRAIGTLEAYSAEPTPWGDEDIGLITSLAAQAGSSLHGAQLFEEVQDARRQLEAIFRTLPIGVLVAQDTAGRTVSGNPAAAALFGAPTDANFSPIAPAPGAVRGELFAGGERLPAERHPLMRALRDAEEITASALEVVTPPERRTAVLVSASPIYDARGAVTGAVCTIVDVTTQRALERELDARRRDAEESSARKTRFLAAVSHDIRTPANAIGLQAELIRRSATEPALAAALPRLAADLQRSAGALVDLVGEMLDITRLDTGRVDLQESDFALVDLVRGECRQLAPVAAAKGLALIGPGSGEVWVHADRVKVARVVGNLLDNAIKFTEHGMVHVRAGVGGDRRPEIVVEDTGPGVPPEQRERIFDEFYQLRNPERDRNKGRGLGLAICRRLMDAMGGELTVDATGGGGARFRAVLPPSAIISPPPRALLPPLASGNGIRGTRIMVADDDEATRRAVRTVLSLEGATVIEAADGVAALRIAREADPQILLLDLMMPGMDGADVLRALAAERPRGLDRIVVLTADRESRDVRQLIALGADIVLPKPIEPSRLLALLCELASRGAPAR